MARDYDDVRIETMPVPTPGPHDALVRVRACGICTGDVTPWYIKKKCPIVLGHEPAGEIVEVGAEVTNFVPGDRVFIHHHAPCFECRACQRGFYSMCATWRASNLVPGGAAEFTLVPRVNLQGDTLKLPAEMTFEEGSLVEPVACVVKAFKRARVQPGDRVAIVGLGFIGQVMIRLAQHYGASCVMGCDKVDFRLEHARKLGAEAVDIRSEDFAAALGADKADVVFVGPSSPAVMADSIRFAGQGSTVLLFMGPAPGEQLVLDPNHLFFNEISLVSSYSCGPDDTRETLELIRQGVIRASELITHRFPLEETLAACRLTARAQDSLKVLLLP